MTMTMQKLRRGTFLHVESELYAYHETRKEMMRIKDDIMYGRSSNDENIGGGRSNLPGDPTGRTAVLLATDKRLNQLQLIVDAIESVYEQLPPEKQKLIRTRYWARTRMLNWEGIAVECSVSRITAIRWRDRIVEAIAEKLGWR